MEQHSDLSGEWIDARQIRTLAQIALDAGQRQVLRVVGATVLPWDDVLDVQERERGIILVPPAILTPVACAVSNQDSGRGLQSASTSRAIWRAW